jgi:chromosome segregation ATPase
MEIKEKIKELENQIEELKKQVQKEEEMEEWFKSLLNGLEMEQWFKSLLNGLEIEIRDDYPDSVFYKKNGKVFFQLFQNLEIKHLWVDYDLVWSVLRNKYKLNYDEIQEFIENMVEKHLKLGIVIPLKVMGLNELMIEKHLKFSKLTSVIHWFFR